MWPGVLPSIKRASSPTASTLPVLTSFATTDGSRKTMPLPLTYTSTLAVPRSIPMSKTSSRFLLKYELLCGGHAWIRAGFKNSGRFDQRRDAGGSLHLAAQLRKKLFEPLVAAVDELQSDDFGLARGRQTGNDQAGASANVGCLDRRARER